MKYKILFILLLTNFALFGQHYEKIVDTNKLWSHVWCVYNPAYAPFPVCQTDFVKFSSDTLIDNHIYKKVLQTNDSAQNNWNLVGFMRDDSLVRTFYRKITDTTESPYYDFNLQINDSIFLNQFMVLVVDSIDSIYFANKIRKKLTLHCIYNPPSYKETWIEGIGSLFGVLNSGWSCNVGAENSLLCFSENDTLKYIDPDYSSCYFNNTYLVNTNDFNLKEFSVHVFPNPVISISTIEISGISSLDNLLEIYSFTGQKIKTVRLDKQMTINKSDFTSGLYIFRLITKTNILTGKFEVE